MPEGLLHLFSRRPFGEIVVDVFDVLIVAWVIYRALLVLRGTRAMQMGTGLGVIFLIYVVARWGGLVTLYNLLSTLLQSIILIVVVVFQNDIRRGLMRVGARAFFSGVARQQETKVIDEVVAAATELARHRIGALICFEQDASLDEFVVSHGTEMDAACRRELLVALFIPDPHNKLHDGAVVIRNLRIATAGVFFPMPDTKVLDKSLGSRHRAALGITEETDAVVVVVSEERGTISYCFNGNIVSNLDGTSLRQVLLGHFGGQRTRKKKQAAKPGRQTGSFRITMPPPTPVAPTPVPPSGLPGSATPTTEPTSSFDPRRTQPGAPRVEPPPRPIAPVKPIEPRPMEPAKPITARGTELLPGAPGDAPRGTDAPRPTTDAPRATEAPRGTEAPRTGDREASALKTPVSRTTALPVESEKS